MPKLSRADDWLEDRLFAFSVRLGPITNRIHESCTERFPAFLKIAPEAWSLHVGTAALFMLTISARRLLPEPQRDRCSEFTDVFAQTAFTKPEEAFAGFADLVGRVLHLASSHPTPILEQEKALAFAGTVGEWCLARCFGWKRVPEKRRALANYLGAMLTVEIIDWFDPDFDPDDPYRHWDEFREDGEKERAGSSP